MKKIKILRKGGKTPQYEKGASSIIPEGNLHREKNNMPSHMQAHLGKKGIPIVEVTLEMKKGSSMPEKVAEVEKEELIFNRELSEELEQLVYQYLETKSDEDAYAIGIFVREEIENNTQDNTGKFLERKAGGNVVKNTKAK